MHELCRALTIFPHAVCGSLPWKHNSRKERDLPLPPEDELDANHFHTYVFLTPTSCWPFLIIFSSGPHVRVHPSAYVCHILIACNPTACPIHVLRCSTGSRSWQTAP